MSGARINFDNRFLKADLFSPSLGLVVVVLSDLGDLGDLVLNGALGGLDTFDRGLKKEENKDALF